MSASPLGPPVQLAYAVTDLTFAVERFVALTGAGPFFTIEHIGVDFARVFGVAATFDHSSAYGQWGNVMVELVQEHSTPIIQPSGALHHVAFMVDDLPAAITWCAAQGWGEVLFARTSGGQEFAFCDARRDLGHLVELYEPSARLLKFYAMVAAAAQGGNPQ